MKQRRGHKLQEMNAKGSLIYRSGGKRFEGIRKPTDYVIMGLAFGKGRFGSGFYIFFPLYQSWYLVAGM